MEKKITFTLRKYAPETKSCGMQERPVYVYAENQYPWIKDISQVISVDRGDQNTIRQCLKFLAVNGQLIGNMGFIVIDTGKDWRLAICASGWQGMGAFCYGLIMAERRRLGRKFARR